MTWLSQYLRAWSEIKGYQLQLKASFWSPCSKSWSAKISSAQPNERWWKLVVWKLVLSLVPNKKWGACWQMSLNFILNHFFWTSQSWQCKPRVKFWLPALDFCRVNSWVLISCHLLTHELNSWELPHMTLKKKKKTLKLGRNWNFYHTWTSLLVAELHMVTEFL